MMAPPPSNPSPSVNSTESEAPVVANVEGDEGVDDVGVDGAGVEADGTVVGDVGWRRPLHPLVALDGRLDRPTVVCVPD